jgi:hypothetical protein
MQRIRLVSKPFRSKPTYANKLHNTRQAVVDCVIVYLNVSGQLRIATYHDVRRIVDRVN